MTKKNAVRIIRQGEVVLYPGAKWPQNGKPVKNNIVGHSETGHHHVIVGDPETFKLVETGEGMFLRITDEGVSLVHQKPAEQHQAIVLTPDTYFVTGKREYVGENRERKVID